MSDPSEETWITVASADEVQTAPWPVIEVAGQDLMLVRSADEVHVVGSRCPHLAAPLVAASIDAGRLTCSRHFYEYRLADGANVHPGGAAGALSVYQVQVVDGMVQIRATTRGPS